MCSYNYSRIYSVLFVIMRILTFSWGIDIVSLALVVMVFLLAVILGVCVILIVSITLNHKWSTVQIYTEPTTSHPVVMNEMTMAGDNYHFRLVCLIHFGFHTISVWVPVIRQQWQELILHWYHFHWYGYNSVSQVTIKACIVLPSVWLESEKLTIPYIYTAITVAYI